MAVKTRWPGAKPTATTGIRATEAAEGDPFALRLDQDERLKRLYMDAEEDSGYVRDRNVFGDGISAEDVMSVTARYRNGVLLTYSLLAFCPWEGYRVAITGDRGRVEMDVCETIGRTFVQGAEETTEQMAQARSDFAVKEIRHYPMFGIPKADRLGGGCRWTRRRRSRDAGADLPSQSSR